MTSSSNNPGTQPSSSKPFSGVVGVSVKGTTVDDLLQHLQSLVTPWSSMIQFQDLRSDLTKYPTRVHGHLHFHSHVSNEMILSYAAQIGRSSIWGQSIHAAVDNSARFLENSNRVITKQKKKRTKKKTALKPTIIPARELEKAEAEGYASVNHAKLIAFQFFVWLHEQQQQQSNTSSSASNNGTSRPPNGARGNNTSFDLVMVDRDVAHQLFEQFCREKRNSMESSETGAPQAAAMPPPSLPQEGLVMSILRQHKLCRSKKYSDGVVFCSFANREGQFAPPQERITQRDELRKRIQELYANKGGITVAEEPLYIVPRQNNTTGTMLVPPESEAIFQYSVSCQSTADTSTLLKSVNIRGRHRGMFQVRCNRLPTMLSIHVPIAFQATSAGVRRATIVFEFEQTNGTSTNILAIYRSVIVRVGNAQDYSILEPTSPYQKKQPKSNYQKDIAEIYEAPESEGNGKSVNIYKDLPQYKVPVDVRSLIECGEMERTLVPPTYDDAENNFGQNYSTFWKKMLYISELQAYQDIQTFDMEQATLQRHGKYFKLNVLGLAEGRPSVLRGDIVLCTWKGKQYKGRVMNVQLLQVHLLFHVNFHQTFDPRVDRVDLIRFTFSRTIFRTSHKGVEMAPDRMKKCILFPKAEHVQAIEQTALEHERILPQRGFRWKTTRDLNEEQEDAIRRIAKGYMRPLPFVIFGPPGTGKTTTVVEAVYQLANLPDAKGTKNSIKILLVAPSNDATDILVERLSEYFEPMQMMRVLAFTRSIDQVPEKARRYVREGLQGPDLAKEMTDDRVRIVVSTVNLAARFWCMGVPKGCFDVLVVDEAGHTTEPEVIATAATLINFNDSPKPGQLVLAGDPMQLGPVITSELCKKFGMGLSYMERLIKTSPAYAADSNAQYPADLVSFLKRNYRSHPSILKLPNEMFYQNKLVCSGDVFKTGSLCQWEHLPCKNFPIVFHGIDGENLREGTSPSWFNIQEAVEVSNYVDILMKQSKLRLRAEEIGIITPYARQVQKIRLLLEKKGHFGIKVGSVETFQGQERRCIIISTVRSETQHLEHDLKYNLGFVANEKRFNVAITRAMALLIVIGNPRVLATDKKNWLPFLAFCKMHGAWRGEEWGNNNSGADSDDEDDPLNIPNEGDEEAGDSFAVPSVAVTHEATGFLNREE